MSSDREMPVGIEATRELNKAEVTTKETEFNERVSYRTLWQELEAGLSSDFPAVALKYGSSQIKSKFGTGEIGPEIFSSNLRLAISQKDPEVVAALREYIASKVKLYNSEKRKFGSFNQINSISLFDKADKSFLTVLNDVGLYEDNQLEKETAQLAFLNSINSEDFVEVVKNLMETEDDFIASLSRCNYKPKKHEEKENLDKRRMVRTFQVKFFKDAPQVFLKAAKKHLIKLKETAEFFIPNKIKWANENLGRIQNQEVRMYSSNVVPDQDGSTPGDRILAGAKIRVQIVEDFIKSIETMEEEH